ncbi:MAG: ABC transporter ATP-binding protein [Streptosporangiaceae bacterium]|jgi:ATP-binding cassette subfamily B protein
MSVAPQLSDADRLLLRTARRGGWWLALLAAASLAMAAAQVLLPAAIGYAVDAAIAKSPTREWLAACAALVLVIVVAEGATALATGTSTAGATARLRVILAGHVIGRGPELLGSFSTGDTVSRIVGGTSDAGIGPVSAVLAVTSVIAPVASVVALGLISPWLMVAFVAGFPPLAMVLRGFVRDSSDISAAYGRAQGAIAGRLFDALTGARTIAAAGTQEAERGRILIPLTDLRAQGDASWRIQARVAAQGMIIVPVMQVVVLAVAGLQLAQHRILPGELIAASQYATLAAGVGAALGQLNRIGRARGGSRRAAGLLTREPAAYGMCHLLPGTGEMRFRSVTVRRDQDVVLRDLDLTIPGGSAVAIVGRSGTGKSTLASVAGRLTDPDEGEVILDGRDLRRFTRNALRTAVVYAFERPALFGDTPEAAISFGAWPPSDADLVSATKASTAETFLARLPDGRRSPLDELALSGGEVQRLGLARAFAHAGRARLLILDDATSSLDTATEMLVSQALAGQMSDRTRLIVAHRATTAARADLVAWLDDGRLRALAPHHELWAEADYRAIFRTETHTEADAAC